MDARQGSRIGMAVVVATVLAAAPSPAHAASLATATLDHGGLTRYFDYYVPDGLPAGPVPLVLVLHGGGGSNADTVVGTMGVFRNVADDEKFIAVYPNGTSALTGLSGPQGQFNWNDCRSDAGPATTTADDVGFIAALIDWAAARFAIDPDRVYAVGGSNGGLMAYRLALELSERFAAIAALIANLPAHSQCPPAPAHPLSVLIIDGSQDTFFMPFEGGQVTGNRGLVLSAHETRDFWRTFLSTGPTPHRLTFPDLDPTDAGTVDTEIYCGGVDGTQVVFDTMNGAGHIFPSRTFDASILEDIAGKQNRDIETARVVWSFFKTHRRNPPPGTAACGDGCVDPGEACDDGPLLGTCCSADCRTGDDCAPCGACVPGRSGCVATPAAACALSDTGRLALRAGRRPAGNGVVWRWRRPDASAMDWGDPRTRTNYALCLYDATPAVSLVARAPAGGRCAGKPCWRSGRAGGFVYRNPAPSPGGLRSVLLSSRRGAGTRIVVKGKGSGLVVPSLPALRLPLRMQLRAGDGGCWEAAYAARRTVHRDRHRLEVTAGSAGQAFTDR